MGSEAEKALSRGPKAGLEREGFGSTQLRVQLPALTVTRLEMSPH